MTIARSLGALALALLLAAALAPRATAQQAPAQPAAAPAPPAAEVPAPAAPIPIPEIVSRVEQVTAELRSLEETFAPEAAIASIERALPALADEIERRSRDSRATLGASPGLEALRDLENAWRALGEPLPDWESSLSERVSQLENGIGALDAKRETWNRTGELARSSGAPEALRGRVDGVIDSIARVRGAAEKRRNEILTLLTQVGAEQAQVADGLAQVAKAREALVSRLFQPDSTPLWSAEFRARAQRDLASETLGGAVEEQAGALRGFATRRAARIPFQLACFVVLALGLHAARRWVRRQEEVTGGLARAVELFESPTAMALLLTILLSPWLYPEAPLAFAQILWTAALLPTVVILHRLLEKPLLPILYALVIFFFVDRLRELAGSLTLLPRLLFLAEMLAAVALLGWVQRPGRLAHIPRQVAGNRALRGAGVAMRAALALFVAAFVLDAVGFGTLGALIGSGILNSAYTAAIAYVAVRILSGLLAFALRVRPLARLRMTLQHRKLLQTRADRLLRWAGFLVWGALTLDLLELRVPAAAAVRRVLTAQLAVGELHVSLGDFAAFGVTVWLAFLVSRFVRFVLEEDVYSHLHLERGMPYAISTLLHYAVLLLGFIFAIAALGVDLNRFAILAGAFGVGIGFGLQNVVNNFVSGLILLFERPLQIGDTVQLGELFGEVKRIGIRASVVRTWDGAEVVVPNGKLISEQLTNWTLSDRHRRIDVSVGVAYGSDPEQVLALLARVAQAHSEVLSEPAPQALFLGFGDSALGFELRGWTAQLENAIRIRSELTVAVSRALAEAGIEIPFPQRDLHVKSLDAEVGSLLVQGRPSRA